MTNFLGLPERELKNKEFLLGEKGHKLECGGGGEEGGVQQMTFVLQLTNLLISKRLTCPPLQGVFPVSV